MAQIPKNRFQWLCIKTKCSQEIKKKNTCWTNKLNITSGNLTVSPVSSRLPTIQFSFFIIKSLIEHNEVFKLYFFYCLVMAELNQQ